MFSCSDDFSKEKKVVVNKPCPIFGLKNIHLTRWVNRISAYSVINKRVENTIQ